MGAALHGFAIMKLINNLRLNNTSWHVQAVDGELERVSSLRTLLQVSFKDGYEY